MPEVSIPTPGQKSSSSGDGMGIPTPLLLAIVGGGIGLIFFLTRKSGGSSDEDEGTLLPNTNIMLGSLQQGILELMGKVTMGDAELSDQMAGLGENLSLQIDTQTGLWQQAFTDLNTDLQGTLGTIQGDQEAIASAIAALGTQNSSLAESLTSVLQHLYATENQVSQVAGGLQGLSSGTSSGMQTILAYINQIMAQQNTHTSMLNGLGQPAPTQPSNPLYHLAPLNVQNQEVKTNYLNRHNGDYNKANAAFLSDYSTNPYHGGFITGSGAWAPLTFWDSTAA